MSQIPEEQLRPILTASTRLVMLADLREKASEVVEMWAKQWDCSASPGHLGMAKVIDDLDLILNRLDTALGRPEHG